MNVFTVDYRPYNRLPQTLPLFLQENLLYPSCPPLIFLGVLPPMTLLMPQMPSSESPKVEKATKR